MSRFSFEKGKNEAESECCHIHYWRLDLDMLAHRGHALGLGNCKLSFLKGAVHFKKKKTFADYLLTPMSSKMSTSFFLQLKRNEGF